MPAVCADYGKRGTEQEPSEITYSDARGSLELEIGEGVSLTGGTFIDDLLAELKEIGVSIAMDDSGIGYSSMSYLRTYPFDVLKIDRRFVVNIAVDQADCERINAAIAMAHGFTESGRGRG